jgi:hypothetical protein
MPEDVDRRPEAASALSAPMRQDRKARKPFRDRSGERVDVAVTTCRRGHVRVRRCVLPSSSVMGVNETPSARDPYWEELSTTYLRRTPRMR